jgi:CubicO group peptidase (beta-lactamase class C family)
MPSLVACLTDIQERLDALARQHGVPGAALAVRRGREALDFATGVANRRTGLPVTPGTAFQIGSITKLLTTTMIMQQVEAGELELDAPVRRYVPAFELSDASGGADELTLRHLLTHSSGLEGDFFESFGSGDEAVGRYVTGMRQLGFVHPPGQLWSYCNSGFVLAGYVLEQVTGQPYHRLLAERITGPLGLRRMTVLAEEMLAGPCAVGHVPGAGGELTVPPVVLMDAAAAPAGSRTVATAAEVATFAQVQLGDGRTPDGQRLYSADSARAVVHHELDRPPASTAPEAQGLGWMLADWDGLGVIGHNGGTIGQQSFLLAIPARDLVVVLLTNAPAGALLWRDLGGWLLATVAGAQMPGVPQPADPPPDFQAEAYAGDYERLGVRYQVSPDEGGLRLRVSYSGPLAELPGQEPEELRLRPVDYQSFHTADADGEGLVSFLDWVAGRPRYLFAGRAARRLS